MQMFSRGQPGDGPVTYYPPQRSPVMADSPSHAISSPGPAGTKELALKAKFSVLIGIE